MSRGDWRDAHWQGIDRDEPSLVPVIVGMVGAFVLALSMLLLERPLARECALLGYPSARVTIWGARFCVDARARSVPVAEARRARVAK